jgi:glycerol kinase
LHNAIVWLDTRTFEIANQIIANYGGNVNHYQKKCGLLIHSYFSALKMKWLLENSPAVAKAAKEGDLCFGTVDSWLIYVLSSYLTSRI